MAYPMVYADFHNADDQGRLRLDCIGTSQDLSQLGIQLREGLTLTFYTDDADDQGRPDDLLVEGVVTFSPEERCWVATIDWNAIRNSSDASTQEANGAATPSAATSPVVNPLVSGEQP